MTTSDRTDRSPISGIYSYPYSLSDDAWGEGLIPEWRQIALLKLHSLFHQEMVLPCSDLISNNVFYKLMKKDQKNNINRLYRAGILRPAISGDANPVSIAEQARDRRSAHRLGTSPNLRKWKKRRKPSTTDYHLLTEHAWFVKDFARPLSIGDEIFPGYPKHLRCGAINLYHRGLKIPGTDRCKIVPFDPDILKLVNWTEEEDRRFQTQVIDATFDGRFGSNQFEIIALSFAARARAFGESSELAFRKREMPPELLPFWKLLDDPEEYDKHKASKHEVHDIPIKVRLRPILRLKFDELIDIRSRTPMVDVRARINRIVEEGGTPDDVRDLAEAIYAALGNVETKCGNLRRTLEKQDLGMKVRALLVDETPETVELACDLGVGVAETKTGVKGLKGLKWFANTISRRWIERTYEADSCTFSYFPISGNLKRRADSGRPQ